MRQDFWLAPSWDGKVQFEPMKMTPAQLFANTHQLHRDFYSYHSILKRMSWRGHWPYWLAFNLLYRQTVVAARSKELAFTDTAAETGL